MSVFRTDDGSPVETPAPKPAPRPTPKPTAAPTPKKDTAMDHHQTEAEARQADIDRAQAHADFAQGAKEKARDAMTDRLTERPRREPDAKTARANMAARMRGEK